MPIVHVLARLAFFFRPYSRHGAHRHLPNRHELLEGKARVRRLLWLPPVRAKGPPTDGEGA